VLAEKYGEDYVKILDLSSRYTEDAALNDTATCMQKLLEGDEFRDFIH